MRRVLLIALFAASFYAKAKGFEPLGFSTGA